ncbi:hypothetical protein HX099_11450 [Thiopseudomonas alkaliphila]|uniref:Uncharacterized protein n=1 Tax=Thiopseudomonas alkaliphila TaxID=1697053 RepID=A0AAW7DTX3_9GAMM|nr:hypothetical protein [Thiopseudomonas alkaliphila]MDM1697266.1 hypothetical protein [Thiopseudomonas alkaliphila]
MSLDQPKVFKVLHQPHSITQYHPKAVEDILWPCLRFAISLQAKADQDLNLFERTLLRLLAEGGSDLQQLSQQMGLMNEEGEHSSLADFISLKLQQLDLITDRLRLTHEGEQVLDKINSAQTRVIGATVYFDLINNCWLPVISRGELSSINAEQTSSGLIEFAQGSVGNIKQIKALPLLSESATEKAPDERDVLDIIKRSRQQNKKLTASSGRSRNDGFVTSSGTISVNSDGELVYLHCYAFSVAGTNTFYVSDGFRSTTQDRFTRGFNSNRIRQSNASIKTAYERLYQKSRRTHQLQAMQESKSLSRLYQALTEKKVKNAIDQAEYENNLSSFVSTSYREIEQILAECYAFSKLDSCISEMATDPQRNADLAKNIASKLGFELSDGKLVNNLLNVNKGSIAHLKAEQPVMSPLIFCHLLAARNNDQQPMAKLATEYPELLSDVAKLRRWRNPIDHADLKAIRNELSLEQIKFIYQLVEKVREILSAWLKDNNNQVPEQNVPNWHKDDMRSQASHKLDSYFGLIRSRMSEHVYKGLFDALVLANLVDARDRTNALAGALQHALYQASQALDVDEAKSIESVIRQLEDLGAESITKSNLHKVQQALNGSNATLGANFMAFWAQITDQQQKEFRPTEMFVKAVDSLNKIRGHSGPILGQHENLNEIEKVVFKLIKRLMEQYCG